MCNVLKKYYQLMLKDKKYLEEYILNKTTENKMYDFMKKQMEECFIRRKINSYEELEKIAYSKDADELLRLGDYYSDEMSELLSEYLKIDFEELKNVEPDNIMSNVNLQKIVEDVDTPKQLKDSILLEQECQRVCKELYEYIMKSKK